MQGLPFEGSENVSGSSGIQARGGLIHEQQGGFGHQLQPYVYPLSLAAAAHANVQAANVCKLLTRKQVSASMNINSTKRTFLCAVMWRSE